MIHLAGPSSPFAISNSQSVPKDEAMVEDRQLKGHRISEQEQEPKRSLISTKWLTRWLFDYASSVESRKDN